jgi:hypothetical protein
MIFCEVYTTTSHNLFRPIYNLEDISVFILKSSEFIFNITLSNFGKSTECPKNMYTHCNTEY